MYLRKHCNHLSYGIVTNLNITVVEINNELLFYAQEYSAKRLGQKDSIIPACLLQAGSGFLLLYLHFTLHRSSPLHLLCCGLTVFMHPPPTLLPLDLLMSGDSVTIIFSTLSTLCSAICLTHS